MENKFMTYGFDAYIKTFQNYHHKNPTQYQQELVNLQGHLDSESQNTVQNFNDLILSLPLPTRDFLVRKTKVYNEKEFQQLALEAKFIKNIHKYYSLYNLEGDEKLEVNVFKYHCGLKLLPPEIRKQIYNKVIIDGGTFFGDSALIFKRYKPCHTICFEPNSINFNKLVKTANKNNLQVTLVQQGLSNKIEEKLLNYISQNQNHGASYEFQSQNNKTEATNLTTIDDFLQNSNFINHKVGLIKLDLEGYGLEGIEGAYNTILQHKPIISCAIYHNPKEMFGVYQALKNIHQSYKIQVFALSQGFILKDLTLLAY